MHLTKMEETIKNQVPQLTNEQQAILTIVQSNDQERRMLALVEYKELVTQPLIDKIEELEPQADNWKKYMDSDNTITVTDLARIIEPNRKQIFDMLREQGLVCKHKALPTMRGIDKGLLVQKFTSNGYPTARITVKGVEYIINYFKGQD